MSTLYRRVKRCLPRWLCLMVMQKLMNFGIRKGTQLAAGKGKPAARMTPAERKAAQDMRGKQ